MSDLLRFEIWQVFFTRKSLWCVFMKGSMRKNWRGVKELLLRPSGNGCVIFVILHFAFALYQRYKFYIFLAPNFQFLYFQIDEQWGLISCTHQSVWNAKNALQLRYTWFPAMTDLLRFEIWKVLLLENLCDVCLWKHRCVKIGAGLKNCCWGQVVTEAWTLLWCIVCLRFTNDINSIFFPLKFAVFLFSNRRAMGSHILHSSIGLEG